MTKLRIPRLRLWQLFGLVTLATLLVWMWSNVKLEVVYITGSGSRVAIAWMDGQPIELWNTFPPPTIPPLQPGIFSLPNGRSVVRTY